MAVLVQLMLGSGTRNPAFRLMTGSLLAFLAGDLVWAVVSQFGWTPGLKAERCIDMIFLWTDRSRTRSSRRSRSREAAEHCAFPRIQVVGLADRPGG